MADSFDLIGKRKRLVDPSSYESVPRDPNDDWASGGGAGGVGAPASGLFNGQAWLGSSIATNYKITALGGVYSLAVDSTKDTLRVALGCNWEYRAPVYGMQGPPSDSYKIFSNSWNTIKIFANSPLTLESWDEIPIEIEGQGDFGLSGASTKERVALNCHAEIDVINDIFPDAAANELFYWGYLMKTGVMSDSGELLDPVVDASVEFTDHYHETFLPFHEKELFSKQPAGKTFFANYST